MDGWDVLGAIKGDPHTASTPVVVVSVIHERGRGFALGASDYLVKPVARDDLLAALRRLVPLPVERAGRSGRRVRRRRPARAGAGAARPGAGRLGRCTPAPPPRRRSTLITDRTTRRWCSSTCSCRTPTGSRWSTCCAADPQTASTARRRPHRQDASPPADRALLDGRIEFVTSKSAVDLGLLAARLAQVTAAPVRARGREAG